jgi:hypothetical protein
MGHPAHRPVPMAAAPIRRGAQASFEDGPTHSVLIVLTGVPDTASHTLRTGDVRTSDRDVRPLLTHARGSETGGAS